MQVSGLSSLAVCATVLIAGLEAEPFLAGPEIPLPRREIQESPQRPAPGKPHQAGRSEPRSIPPRPQVGNSANEDSRNLEELQLIPAHNRPTPAPLPSDLEWIRPAPISLDMLRGQVVLIEVWESSCVPCLRSLPVLSQLQARYGALGFLVIGIHSPEFSFTSNRSAVDRAVRRFGLEFPVASDPRQTFWRSWDVKGWPTAYLLDVHGQIAHLHLGEISPRLLERRVRALLRERWPQARFPPPDRAPSNEDSYAPECGFVTPDIPTIPGLDFLLNPEGYRRGQSVTYADPGPARSEGTFYLKGSWSWLQNGLQRGASAQPASIGITYRAKEVYAVIANTGDGPLDIEIRQDGRSLTGANKGNDVEIARDGRSYLRVGESRLHYLVVNSDVGRHDLELSPSSAAFQIHNFSFGNRCQTAFPHR